MEKITCEKCNKKFSTEEALQMHTRAKHTEIKKESKSISPKKKIRNWTITIIILASIVFGISYLKPENPEGGDLLSINLRDHTNLALHFHPFLEIEVDGENQLVPANIGVSNTGMKIAHTHNNDGEIHVETPTRVDVFLYHFFQIWGKEFNSECIFDHCVDETHELKVFVNGVEDNRYENILLKDGDKIKIVYSEI